MKEKGKDVRWEGGRLRQRKGENKGAPKRKVATMAEAEWRRGGNKVGAIPRHSGSLKTRSKQPGMLSVCRPQVTIQQQS